MIRMANKADMPAVVRIAEAVQLNLYSPQPHLLRAGFLVYVLDQSDYARRANPFFTVSVGEEGATGFLMCYDGAFLQELIDTGAISHQDGAVDFLLDQPQGSFIFGDQIAIDPATMQRGVGRELMLEMFERMRKGGISTMFVTILHEPVRNDPSIRFCTTLGAECVAEVTNKDGLTWGIYRFVP